MKFFLLIFSLLLLFSCSKKTDNEDEFNAVQYFDTWTLSGLRR